MRFQGFQNGWQEKILEEIITSIVSGKTTPSTTGVFPVYGSMGIIGFCDIPTHKGKYLLIARVGANAGSINNVEGEFSATDNTLILGVKENISINFLYQKLLSYNLNKLIFGSGQPLITGGELKCLKLFFPEITEQSKIARLLNFIDDRISTQSQIIKKLQSLIKGLSEKLYTQEVRFPEFKGKWDTKLGGEIFKRHSNKHHYSDLPIVAVTKNKGVAKREDIDYNITVEDKSIQSYKVIEKGDFVISLRSFEGGIEYSEITGICSPAYTILKSQIPIVDNFYKAYLKRSSYIALLNERIEGIRDGKNISFENFSIIPLPYPTISEQNKIANFLSAIDEKLEIEKQILKKYTEQKKYLLANMFI